MNSDMTLQEKILSTFEGKVVRKDLAFKVKGGQPVPTFVLEYLLAQHCASSDETIIAEGVERVKKIIRDNYINRADSEEIKGKIREKGSFTIIDKVTAVLNDKSDCYVASFANLDLTNVPIADDIVRKNNKLLSGNGVWSIVTIGYLTGDDVRMRWEIQKLKPIQVANIDLEFYKAQRSKFTTEEWIDFLIHTVGLNPDNLNKREKMITLSRLLPMIENNFNFMELGPKGTGKSHVFEEFSPYGVLVSGGDVTSARLFVKMSGNREILGLVGYWDVVAWDEFEQQKGRAVDAVLIDTMQNYLANKQFNRGKGTHEASASMCFVGNTKHTVPFMLKNSHLFESIPTSFIKGAFLDRIHLYNPGWEIKMLKKDSFSQGFGLITDYIAAILHEMRNIDLSSEMSKYVKFDGSLSERDNRGILKTFSGMIKLLYPDGNYTEEDAIEIINFAAEARKRVKDQLYIVDETFRAEPAKFQYTRLSTGELVKIETLENISYPREEEDNEPAVSTSATTGTDTTATKPAEDKPKRPRIHPPVSKIVNVRQNQTGVSYKSLFGDYFRGAHTVKVVDPYLTLDYQKFNLMEFIQTVYDCAATKDGLKIHLSTKNDTESASADMEFFTELASELESIYGIEFTFDFHAKHDRSIQVDNDWFIVPGRGLDIFEKIDTKFSMRKIRDQYKPCREFSITYNPCPEELKD